MAKTKVTFRILRITDDDWTILADYPGSEQREIKGLTSKEDAQDWVNGDRKVAWLRSQGYVSNPIAFQRIALQLRPRWHRPAF
jgi:hypothetical protein